MRTKKSAFSLLELMIVIAILGIVTAVAVPTYESYVLKAKMNSVLTTLQSFMNDMLDGYNQTDSFPSQISSDGFILINLGGDTPYSANPNIVTLDYQGACNFTGGISNCKVIIEAVVSQELGGGRIMLGGIPDGNGGFTFYCGTWTSTSAVNSTQYLPSTCNNYSISTL